MKRNTPPKQSKTLSHIIIVLAMIAFGCVVLGPKLLSTSLGKELVIRAFGSSTTKKIAFSTLSLNWLGPQEVHELSIADGEKTLLISEIKINSPLWSLLRSKPDLGHTVINNLSLQLQPDIKKEVLDHKKLSTNKNPKKTFSKHLSLPFSGQLEVHRSEIEIVSLGVDPIAFKEIEIEANFPTNVDLVNLTVVGKTFQGTKQGTFHLHAEHKMGLLDVDAEIADLPVMGLDQLVSLFNPKFKGLLVSAIGPSLNLDLNVKASHEQFKMDLTGHSPHFSAEMHTMRKNGEIVLQSPAAIQFTATPALSAYFLPQKFSLKEDALINLSIKELTVPILDLSSLTFQADLAMSKLTLSPTFSIEEIKGSIFSKRLQEGIFGELNALSTQNGKQYPFNIRSEISNINDLSPLLVLSIDTQQFQLPKARFKLGEKIELQEPALCMYIPLPSTLSTYGVEFASNAPLTLTLHSFSLPLLESIEKVRAAASINTPQITIDKNIALTPFNIDFNINTLEQIKCIFPELTIKNLAQKKEVKIEKGDMEFRFYPKAGTLFTHFSAQVQDAASMPGSLQGTLTVDHVDFSKECPTCNAMLEMHLEAKHFPLSIVEMGLGKSLIPLFGPTVNLDCTLESSPQNQLLSVKATTPYLNVEGAFAIANGILTLKHGKQDLKGTLSLTPDGFSVLNRLINPAIHAPIAFELAEVSTLFFHLTDLVVPLSPTSLRTSLAERIPRLRDDQSQLAAKGSLKVDRFPLLEKKSSQILTLRDLNLDVAHPNLKAPLSFTLSGNVISSGISSSSKEKQITINGSVDQFTNSKGEFDLKNLSSSLKVNIHEFPVIFLDVVTRLFGKTDHLPSHLIGPYLNATAEVNIQSWSGPISLNVNAKNSRLSLTGQVKQGVLTLSEPVYAQVTMTPELSTLLLNEVNPLSIKTVSAKNPFTLQIDPKGFSFPLYPFSLSKIQIPTAILEFGQISCENGGNLSLALSLLKARALAKEKQTKLWFAPIVIHLKEGVLNCERTEILVADAYEIATWGHIDLVKNKVNMVLGLTAQCLQKAFGITKLPEDYVLQLPMKGKMNEVKINSAKATAKIAALMAWQQNVLGDAFGGGFGANLLNELLGTLGTLPDKDASYPPARRPFPWDNQRPKETSSKKAIKKSDKPLKQLMKTLR